MMNAEDKLLNPLVSTIQRNDCPKFFQKMILRESCKNRKGERIVKKRDGTSSLKMKEKVQILETSRTTPSRKQQTDKENVP
eukprot:CAMPEP_0172515294 /NCGR_PEP_ID=MMETSP1066-20121228/266876_1 /TAXON_ID=671091 /ORGANISM="Coscinodiscus wailesii, Strain CCMP2513" /LENGTH=80 /DNA_ID=CAMNT_0013296313 /DNA_START=73 /DNA_END=312 /DNA_ORIENTATION=-